MDEPFRVAAVQAAPVFMNRQATVDKACRLIAEVGEAGARLAVFPEAFIPGYPLWVWFIPAGRTAEWREVQAELVEQSVSVPGPETEQLCAAAREASAAAEGRRGARRRRVAGRVPAGGERRLALQLPALRRTPRRAPGHPSQAGSHRRRAHRLGARRRQHAPSP